MSKHYLTPDGKWKSERNPYLQHRASMHDYKAPGTYMITLCVNRRQPLFGTLVEDQGEVSVRLSEIGQMVEERWKMLPVYTPQLVLQDYQFMPDHLHAIIWVKEPLERPLGQILRSFKMGCTACYRALMRDADGASMRHPMQLPQVQTGRASLTKAERMEVSRQSLWEPNYNDRIAFTQERLDVLQHYIHDNPRRLWLKRHHASYFALMRNVQVETPHGLLSFSAIGNMQLLGRARKQVIQCSRSLTEKGNETAFAAWKQTIWEQAQAGVVSISGCISKGEQQLCRQLREAGLPIVVLLKDGFPAETDPAARFYKPGGVYFDACASGRLLLLEPTEETLLLPYVAERVKSKSPVAPATSDRYRFLALNAIAELLCGIAH